MAYRQQINALRKRKKAIKDNDKNAVTGSDGQSTEDKVQQEHQQQQQDANTVAQAERRATDIERQWKREGQSNLDNEIEDIIELRDEYKKLIQTMLDYEKAKPEDKQDKTRIAELERKMVDADREAEKRIAQAKANAKGDVANAERQATDIERRLRRERQSELDNEIEDIIALRDEYKKLIQTMLDFERAKDRDKQDQKKIAELERKLAEADKTAQDRIATARTEAAKRLQDDVASFRSRFDDAKQGIHQRREEAQQDRDLDNLMKDDPNSWIIKLQQLIAQYQKAANDAKAQFERELQAAQSDGKIDNRERERLNNAQTAYIQAESLVDKYSEKLRNAKVGTDEAVSNLKTRGSFYAAALDSLGTIKTEERVANATEQIVVNTKKTNDLLKRKKELTFS